MSFGGFGYAGASYAGSEPGGNPGTDTRAINAVEWSPTTGALEEPAWVDITLDARSWDVFRGRNRELERHQPGRATIVLQNRDRAYDSLYADGPNFGNIKPGKQVRIRATYNGVTYPVFTGTIDQFALDYPHFNKDATATILATDMFKLAARTELPPSVYWEEVNNDIPEFWWKFNENLTEGGARATALNAGSVGSAADGTYVGQVDFGRPGLIVNDPGGSIGMRSSDVFAGVPVSGVDIPVSEINLLDRVNNRDPFTLEVWVRPTVSQTQALVFFMRDPTGSISSFALFWFNNVGGGNTGQFRWRLAKTSTNYDLDSAPSSAPPDKEPYHVVLTGEQEGANLRRRLYLNGTQVATDTVAESAFDDAGVDHNKWGGGVVAGSNFTGDLQEAAIYLSVLSSTRISAHHDAGSHPWQGDDADARADRILDLMEWPADRRELDDGAVTFQSAELGTTALEHLQKIAESETPALMFVNRTGDARFVSRATVFARTPDPTPLTDDGGGVGYSDIRFSEADDVIRNRATVSRLNGKAQAAEDTASVTEFGRTDLVLDGLLNDSDAATLAIAEWVVDEYADLRRRVTSVTLGPFPSGEETTGIPFLLGRELGDAITVEFTPLGDDEVVSGTYVIESIRISSAPGGILTATWGLSPEYVDQAV